MAKYSLGNDFFASASNNRLVGDFMADNFVSDHFCVIFFNFYKIEFYCDFALYRGYLKIKFEFSRKILDFEARNRLSVGEPYRLCHWQQNQPRNRKFKIFTPDLEFFKYLTFLNVSLLLFVFVYRYV